MFSQEQVEKNGVSVGRPSILPKVLSAVPEYLKTQYNLPKEVPGNNQHSLPSEVPESLNTLINLPGVGA